jgi:hypothetical protein
MAKAKDLRKNGFSPYCQPISYTLEPLEFFIDRKVISKNKLDDESEVIFDPSKRYFISLGLDHGYYPGDSTPEAYLVEFEELKTINKKYESQLRKYEKDKVTHEENVERWKAWKKLYDAEQKASDELRQRKEYLKLKKIYEK